MFTNHDRSRVGLVPAALVIVAVLACPAGASCPADVDSNGEVGVPDLLTVLQDWGYGSGTSDFTGPDQVADGLVNAYDLLGVLNSWGSCP